MINVPQEYSCALQGKRFIDLFAGIGAFRLALTSFGTRCVFSCEWDKDAQNTYFTNYGEMPAGDITKIDEKEIPQHDILCAGFPCQPFSISGKQLGFNDTRGTLFFEVARIIKHWQPEIVLLENVKNFVSHNNGKTHRTVTNTVNELGYNVYYDILNAANYGVPQKRERVYFVCFRKDLNIHNYAFPKPFALQKHLCDILEPKVKVKDYIIKRNDIMMNDNVVDHFSNTALRLGIINKGGQGERIYSTKGVAVTLSAYGGGAGAKTGLYLDGKDIRKLSPRECARADGFPDTFIIPKNRNIAYKQFGNSVVVDVLQYIIFSIIMDTGYISHVN